MSEHIGEASIFIRPDTTKFREELIAQLTAATKGVAVTIPTAAVGGGGVAKVTARNEALASSTKKAGAAAAELSAQETQLAQAGELAATAQAELEKVEKAGALTTTSLAKARAELRQANKALVAAEEANAAALATENAELKANTAATLAAAAAAVQLAESTALEGAAHARTAKAEAVHAAQHHALTTGARAAGASLTGLRGATLATSGGFLIGAASVKLLEESIHEASTEEAAAIRTTKVFGEAAHELEHEARGLADTFGLSAAEALNFESKLGNLLKTAGFTTEESAHLSETLVKLAADMASFQNVPIDQVLKAIQLGLVGNSRGLRQFQVELNQARVNAVALRLSGKENVKQLDQEDKIRARVNLLLQQTAIQQGAAARNADQFAQKEKVAKAELANLGGTIGRAVLPKVSELLTEANLLIGVLSKVGDAAETLASKVGGSRFGKAVGNLEKLLNPTGSPFEKFKIIKGGIDSIRDAFKDPNDDLKDLNFQGEKFSGTLQELHARAVELFQQKSIDDFNASILEVLNTTQKLVIKAAQVSFRNAVNDVARLDDAMNQAIIAGNGVLDVGTQLDILNKKALAQQRAVEAATAAAGATRGRSGHDTAIKNAREQRAQLADTLQEIQGIKEQQNQDLLDTLDKIQQAVEDAKRKAQELIDQANQDTQDLIEAIGRPAEIKALRVQATASLQDDLAFQEELQRLAKARIALASRIIGDEKLKAELIHEQTLALIQSQIEEKALRKQIEQNAKDRKREKLDREEASLDLDIEFAQTKHNVSAEIKAHQAKIRFLKAQQAHTKEGTNEWKKLRNEIAAEQQAIKDLKKQTEKLKEDFQALQFEFLQTESGFAENLLSNVVGVSQIAGTVGGGIGTPTRRVPTVVPPADFARAAHQRDLVGTASSTAATGRGASAGQMSTLIHVARQQVVLLQRLAGTRQTPESAGQKVQQHVSMDIIGW